MLIKKYGKEKKVVGFFEGSTPFVLCTDPEMIKQIMIKDFSNFVNRRVNLKKKVFESIKSFFCLISRLLMHYPFIHLINF